MLTTLVDGKETNYLPVNDRGLQYGDGVWETIAVRAGQTKQLTAHLQRLKKGLNSLDIIDVNYAIVEEEILSLASKQQDGIIKVIISRGSGGRGFYYDQAIQFRRIISLHPLPTYPSSYYQQGIRLVACETRLPHNPRLAGFKCLGCIEQVLARAELPTSFQEGLLCDYDNHVIEGTMSNLFIITQQDTVITPDLQMCGVEGIARSCIINVLNTMKVACHVTTITEKDLQNAKALFISNSIIRLWPIKEYVNQDNNNKTYTIPPLLRTLERTLNLIL